MTLPGIPADPSPEFRLAAGARYPYEQTPVALVDLLDRVLAGGVVLDGDLTISVADVDLVHISLRALITSVRTGMFLAAPQLPRP